MKTWTWTWRRKITTRNTRIDDDTFVYLTKRLFEWDMNSWDAGMKRVVEAHLRLQGLISGSHELCIVF